LIPPFNEFGYLPPGIHVCTFDELVARFGSGSPEREVESQELAEFVDWARRSGVSRMIVNGSYATSKISPYDVDVVILPGAEYPRVEMSASQQASRWPFLQIFVAIDEADLIQWSVRDFGTDRSRRPKGVIEVLL
jgi:hypothetical protein